MSIMHIIIENYNYYIAAEPIQKEIEKSKTKIITKFTFNFMYIRGDHAYAFRVYNFKVFNENCNI